MAFAWAFLLAVVLFAAWVLTLLGMPGNWLMVAAVVVYVLLMPAASPARTISTRKLPNDCWAQRNSW